MSQRDHLPGTYRRPARLGPWTFHSLYILATIAVGGAVYAVTRAQ